MKRTHCHSEPVILLEAKPLWDLAESLGISQELKAYLRDGDDSPAAVRLAICQHFPEFISTLEAVEGIFLAATDFVNACLSNALKQAPVYTPPRASTEALVQVAVLKKKKEEVLLRDKEGRKALIERCSFQKDLLSKEEYTPRWLSDYKIVGQPVTPSDVPDLFSTYSTIYHCLSEWGMDTLLDLLHADNYLAFGIRNESKRSEECVRFKVITNEPYNL